MYCVLFIYYHKESTWVNKKNEAALCGKDNKQNTERKKVELPTF